MDKKNIYYSIFLLIVFAGIYTYRSYKDDQLLEKQKATNTFTELQGICFGVVPWSVKYKSEQNLSLKSALDSLLEDYNQTLSTYQKSAEITRFNQGERVCFSRPYFYEVLERSALVWKLSNGNFDPTVNPLVEAWGFGPNKGVLPDSAQVRQLMRRVGFQRIQYDDSCIAASTNNTELDFSAIAKGHAVDLTFDFLTQRYAIENLFIEIGGEVRTKGKNADDENWRLGIEDPSVEVQQRRTIDIIGIQNKAIATSGNYRNFKVIDGKRYHHTIDPKTGFNKTHSLLSATVMANDCMTADAFATAFMVSGLEEGKVLQSALPDSLGVEVLFIYEGKEGLAYYRSEGFPESLLQ